MLPTAKWRSLLQAIAREFDRMRRMRTPMLRQGNDPFPPLTSAPGARGEPRDQAVTLVVDLAERKRAEQPLRERETDLAHMNRLSIMGKLAASLAHEITQPIASARNNARAALNFLSHLPPQLDDVGEALDCVLEDVDRARAILDRIRDHIKKAPPRKQAFDLNDAVIEVLDLARTAIAKNEVTVQTRLAERLAPVQGDRVQLQQVLLNLILNAVEAIGDVNGGPRNLSISTKKNEADDFLVTVRDSGPGIDADRLDRVFEEFYTTKPNGVGVGLSICRSIVVAHGGRLWAEVNQPRGAAFQFTLPRAGSDFRHAGGEAPQSVEPHEDTGSDPARQRAFEGGRYRSARWYGRGRLG
jgi:C4-dicarboxylate-specific signal transduction histidine kinase